MCSGKWTDLEIIRFSETQTSYSFSFVGSRKRKTRNGGPLEKRRIRWGGVGKGNSREMTHVYYETVTVNPLFSQLIDILKKEIQLFFFLSNNPGTSNLQLKCPQEQF